MMRSSLFFAAACLTCTAHGQFITGVDPLFGGNAGLITWNDGGVNKTRPHSTWPRPDGKTLVVGTNYSPSNNVVSPFSTLLDAEGRPVEAYGSHGTCNYALENGHGFMGKQLFDAAMQSDGKAILLCWNPDNGTASIVRLRLDGEVDSTFATNGVIALGNLGAECLAVQNGDRILVGGAANTDLFIRRYTANGQLDATFGTGGTYADPLSGRCYRLHELADGRWLVVGRSPGAVILLSADGVPDASYGSNGHATEPQATGFTGPNDAALQPDGKIILAFDSKIRRLLPDGAAQDPVFPYNNNNFVGASQLFAASDGSWYYYFNSLVKMTAADVVDATFGTSGALSPVNGPTWVSVQEGGPIHMVGAMASGGQQSDNGFAARYTPDGQVDATWGVNAQAYFTGNDAWAQGGNAIFDASGRIVVMGRPWSSSGCMARFDTDGVIDATFSFDGIVSLAQSDAAVSVTSQSSDQLVVAGFTIQGNGANGHVARFNADGAWDATYFEGLPFSAGLNQQRPTDVVTMPDDQVAVIANLTDINSGGVQTAGVAMISTSGDVNTSFATNGVFQQVQQGYQAAGSITLDPDGNLLCTVAELDGTGEFGILFFKLDPSGALVASFGNGGFQHVDLPQSAYGLQFMGKPHFLADGRFYLCFHVSGGDYYGGHVARFLATGELDPAFNGGIIATYPNSLPGTIGLLGDGSVICASVDEVDGVMHVQKFQPTGLSDAAFGDAGNLDISDALRLRWSTAHVLVGPNDRVFVSGVLNHVSGWNTSNFDPYLFHLDPDFSTDVEARGPLDTHAPLVFPSPTVDEFTVRLAASPMARTMAYDATGRIAPIEAVRRTADSISYRFLGQPSAGVYTLVVTDASKSTCARLIVAEQ